MDFLRDVLVSDDKKVRVLNILDECSRKVLLSFASKNISAKTLVKLIGELVKEKDKPAYLRCDNGPEFVSKELEKFAKENTIEIRRAAFRFSQPGKPTQNGLVERLNGTQRKECLNLKYFKTIQQVQIDLDKWWNEYNRFGVPIDRPHSSLGYMTPQQRLPQQFIDNNANLYFNLAAA